MDLFIFLCFDDKLYSFDVAKLQLLFIGRRNAKELQLVEIFFSRSRVSSRCSRGGAFSPTHTAAVAF